MTPPDTFDVLEFRVLGNSVLAPGVIERAVYPFLGPNRSIDAVEQARAALEKAYRDAGYGTVFVDTPEQHVSDGIVRLRATEGRVDRVRITGAKYFSNGQIRDAVAALRSGSVLHLPELQAQLGEVNRQSRDRVITPVLKAGRTPGTVDVELKVEDELPMHGGAELNNRYTADTSETRLSLDLSYGNLFQKFHSLSLQYQTAPEERQEARVLAATYVAPVGSRGDMLAVYFVDTDSEVATVGTLAVLGKGQIAGARYILPLPASKGYFHSVSLGGDYKNFSENLLLSAEEGWRTPIEYANWSVTYTGDLRAEGRSTSFNIGANLGLRGLANDADEFENKRYKARPNYFYLRADARHLQDLFMGTRLALRAAAQYTVEPLISNEQFSIGGADSVRGYLESEELGDYGISGSVEFQSPPLTFFGATTAPLSIHALSFFDAGVVSVVEPLPEQDTRMDLSSWGLGLRLAGFGGLQADLDWARPLVSGSHVEQGDSRIHFRIHYGF